jgi:hypothetical protein
VKADMDKSKREAQYFYVVYILSAGLIDDIQEVLKLLDDEWSTLPVQIHLINLSTKNIETEDLDTKTFMEEAYKINS